MVVVSCPEGWPGLSELFELTDGQMELPDGSDVGQLGPAGPKSEHLDLSRVRRHYCTEGWPALVAGGHNPECFYLRWSWHQYAFVKCDCRFRYRLQSRNSKKLHSRSNLIDSKR